MTVNIKCATIRTGQITRPDTVICAIADIRTGHNKERYELLAVTHIYPEQVTSTCQPTSSAPTSRDSSVGVTTGYDLDGPEIESRWGRDLAQPASPALGPTPPSVQWLLGLFPGGKATMAWH